MADGHSSPGIEASQAQMRNLFGRDFELLGLGAVVITALLLGMLAFIACSAAHYDAPSRSALPQLIAGLIALVVLLNTYMVSQRKTLHRATALLIQQVASESIVQKYSFIDPVTQLFSREYLEHALAHELMKVHQQGSSLTFLLLQVSANGDPQEKQCDAEVAHILRSTFRGSDTIIRFENNDFLVMLSETAEPGARVAMRRLLEKVDGWNATSSRRVELTLAHKLYAYAPGKEARVCIEDLANSFASLDQTRPALLFSRPLAVPPPLQLIH